ncbi:MAG: MATE family efflux transporter [Spirochaetales bacterium]|uniref:Multidrug-efflux transporter n=1 Tax=Candidatus Thalassospirochaeta sargassi TaxID=3119039 RepID=A0AAJ1MIZ8_9SPIO|nr:MATE family efflux transporter [Spirochaetales bacterium]
MFNKNRNPLKNEIYISLFKIAAPVALQNLIISSLSFVDTLMIGQLGEVEIAAVGIGNQLFFLYTLLLFGIGSASGIFVSQFWGKKDYASIRKTSGLSVLLGLAGALPFSFLSLIIPEKLVGIFSTDREVIRLGADYVSVVAVSYLFSAVVITMSQVQRSIEKANLPFIVSAVSLGMNTLLNWLLIFGKAGFPALGVSGAAIATAVARGVECILLIVLIYNGRENPAAGTFREMTGFSADFLKRFIKTASPVIINELFWALGMTVFKVVYGRMGTSALASVNIAEAVMNLMFVAMIGSSTGTAVLTGKKIGEGDYDGARRNGRSFIKFALIEGIVIALICAAFSGILPRGFNVDDSLKQSASIIILIFSAFLPFKSFNIHSIVGIFRGGGDTLFAAVTEIAGVWGVGVVLAFITGIYLELPVYIVYAFVSLEEVVKSVICMMRVRSEKWVHDLT